VEECIHTLFRYFLVSINGFLLKAKGYQLKAEECGAERRTLPLNFFAFSGKPSKKI
jgi:hypothetical protein